MQIRLTVLGPRSGRAARASDVIVTAPVGTALGAVAGALASGAGSGQPTRSSAASIAFYAGAERLDPASPLGVPPLVDGAVLSLHAPAEPHAAPSSGAPAAARLHVVGGPDAGGVHLLQGGLVRVGRSADADVPLDDPDVSRLHCLVTVGDDGLVTVADSASTNGTTLDGCLIGDRPVPLRPGALLRVGESTLRLAPDDPGAVSGPAAPPAIPDAEGHLRVTLPESVRAHTASAASPPVSSGARRSPVPVVPPAEGTHGPDGGPPGRLETPRRGTGLPAVPAQGSARGFADGRSDASASPALGGGEWDAGEHGGVPQDFGGRGPADGTGRPGTPAPDDAYGPGGRRAPVVGAPASAPSAVTGHDRGPRTPSRSGDAQPGTSRVAETIGAWARRLTGGRSESGAGTTGDRARPAAEAEVLRERWPDPAAVLLTALGPGPRLWERGPGHPDALTVRLGTADLPAEDGTGLLPSVPFTVDLRDPHTFTLGLSGPRPRLAGLARAVLAQTCALHSPSTLELVLISADRTRGADQRADEWAWANWLPHLRPAHGQDCRLLLAFDREQAEARTAELTRRLDDGPLGTGWAGASQQAVAEAAAGRAGLFTLLVVDGDPGSAALRETVGRIAAAGPSAGIHVLCLSEPDQRPAARCGAVARLTGDVATMLRLEPHGPDQIVVDAVSPAWAERFARALAPLREGDSAVPRPRSALPRTARLLDELDLALATPAKISARWAAGSPGPGSPDGGQAAGRPDGAARAVIGAGPHGPVTVDLVAEGPHLLVGGAPGSGKTELLRAVASALAAHERPDRLALVLVDGAGTERGDGLRVCTDLPHVSSYLSASDPVRMREFSQSLGAELKRRAELLGGVAFEQWHADRGVTLPRQTGNVAGGLEPSGQGAVTVRTRLGQAPARLVVIVDDFDVLVAPGLGNTGRPSAGSVVRVLEAVARDGERLGVHLVAATGRPECTAGTETDEAARLRMALRMEDPESAALLVHVDDPAALDENLPGRGYLRRPGGGVTPVQVGRVSARIPRTATLRPTVVPLEWERMGDPPTRRPLRELGNGPTDLALLASALQRAAESAGAVAPPL